MEKLYNLDIKTVEGMKGCWKDPRNNVDHSLLQTQTLRRELGDEGK